MFLRDPKTFKLPTVNDNEWHDHKPRSVRLRVHDLLGVNDSKRLTRLQYKVKIEGLIRTQKRKMQRLLKASWK